MNFSTEKKLKDLKNRVVVAKGEGEGEGVRWTGNLGLIDAEYCVWSEQPMKSYCMAQRNIS